MLKILVLDTETTKKPLFHPWQKGASIVALSCKIFGTNPIPITKTWYIKRKDVDKFTKAPTQVAYEFKSFLHSLGTNHLIVGHNLKFDYNWLYSIGINLYDYKLWDTMVGEYLINGQNKQIQYNLDSCCARRGISRKTDKVKEYWDAGVDTWDIPPDILIKYIEHDVDITAQLFKQQYHDFSKFQQTLKMARVQMQTIHILAEIERNGMPFNVEMAKKYVSKYKQQVKTIEHNLKVLFGRHDINLDSGQELSAGLFGGIIKRKKKIPVKVTRKKIIKEPYKYTYKSGKRKGLTVTKYRNKKVDDVVTKEKFVIEKIKIPGVGFKPPLTSKTLYEGVFQTNRKVLQQLACPRGGKLKQVDKKTLLDNLLKRSKIIKFIETFVGKNNSTGLLHLYNQSIDKRLHPNYNQTITATGRLSSSNPNGQNFPRAKVDSKTGWENPLKKIFVAPKDWVILVADVSQFEWRTAAFLSQDKTAIHEILSGIDYHSDNAARIFGDISFRNEAKALGFLLLYGGSWYGLWANPDMPNYSKAKWKKIVAGYWHKYSGLALWQESNLSKAALNSGKLVSPTGRIYHIPEVDNRRVPGTKMLSPTAIKNYPVQGTATADFMPFAMCVAEHRLYSIPEFKGKYKWIGQVHDSMIFEVHKSVVFSVGVKLIKVYEDLPRILSNYYGFNMNVPLTGTVEYGPSYGKMTYEIIRDTDTKGNEFWATIKK